MSKKGPYVGGRSLLTQRPGDFDAELEGLLFASNSRHWMSYLPACALVGLQGQR